MANVLAEWRSLFHVTIRTMHSNPDSELCVVAQFLMEQEFLFARGRLESAGIECFCSNEYLSRISSGIYNGMTGGIALKVRREDLADARAILDDPGKPYLVR
jgi:hypothetical protein